MNKNFTFISNNLEIETKLEKSVQIFLKKLGNLMFCLNLNSFLNLSLSETF